MVEPLGRVENATQFRGHGAMGLSAPVAVPDIGAAWRTITEYDGIAIPGQDVALDTGAGSISFEEEGIWLVSFFLSMEFTDINSGRTYSIRLWNNTDSTQIADVIIAVGRNQAGSTIAIPLLANIDAANLNDAVVFQIGNASTTIAGVTFDSLRADVALVNLGSISNPP